MQGMCGSLMVQPKMLTQLTSLQRLELVRCVQPPPDCMHQGDPSCVSVLDDF